MSRASLLQSRSSKLLLCAALAFVVSACAGTPSLYDYITVAPAETQVWNNFMPGSKPNCSALMRLHITNPSETEIVLRDPELVIAEPDEMHPLRKFPAILTVNDQRSREARIAPGETVVLAFRSPSFGLEPIDTEKYPRVRLAIRLNSSVGLPLHFRSPIVDIFDTH